MCDGKLMVPVPSRLHFQRTQQKPLNGLRVTVKDIIDLKGVKTTGQSRSYEKLYGPRTETAAIVKRLVELGAVIVGKTKCTQFASSDQPTADWVDYHCPWNPRGDGYLSPRGSSTGTCVALAGYDWVDVGIGSDSGCHSNLWSYRLANDRSGWEYTRSSSSDGSVCAQAKPRPQEYG